LPFRPALFHIALAFAPLSWKPRLMYRGTLQLPWLTPNARREVREQFLARFRPDSPREGHPVERFHESRYLEVSRAAGNAFARDAGSVLLHPFRDPRFFRAWIRWAPTGGYPSRAAALEAHFGDILPRATTRRSTKASFTEAAWGPGSREFARQWDGTGLDLALVDPDELRGMWSRPRPDFRSVSPLHAAWLATQPRNGSTEIHTAKQVSGD
jgi:asparagine synthase (glutamine-hydrolysing)